MDFLSNADGDIAIVNGDFVLVSGVAETVQFLQQSLRLFLGEWFLDETRGVPWLDQIFVKNPDAVLIDSTLKTFILSLPGILQLTAFDLLYDSNARTLTITGSIVALDGEADFSVSNVLPGGN